MSAVRFHEGLGVTLGEARRLAQPHLADVVRRNLLYLGLAEARTPEVEHLVRQTFRAFGLFVVEFARSLAIAPREIPARWRVRGRHHLDALNKGEAGWILAGAHTGNWEHLGALGTWLGRRLIVPTGTQFHPWLSPAIKGLKRRRGVVSVPTDHRLRRLTDALAGGDLVAFPLDGGSFRRGLEVRLLGRPVRLATGAARLSLLTGRPILPVLSRRTGFMQQEVCICPPLWPPVPGEGPALPHLMEQLAATLGEHLLRARGQWCVFRPVGPA